MHQYRVGQKVSFIHEGAGFRLYGVVTKIEDDTLFVDVSGREYEVYEPLDEVESEELAS